MRQVLSIFVFSVILWSFGAYAGTTQQHTAIASKGKTVIVAKSAKFNVRVIIKTHEVQIGKPSDKRLDVIRSSCTYSRYPCSIVDYIDIDVNGKAIVVPRSVFCDLSDLNAAEVQINRGDAVVTLTGGDASESYMVKIEFDTEHVKRKSEYWSEYSKDEPSEETTYHKLILGN